MITIRATAALLAAIVLSMSLAAGSAAKTGPVITEAFVDFVLETITITGESPLVEVNAKYTVPEKGDV